jgi:hypothetical protein
MAWNKIYGAVLVGAWFANLEACSPSTGGTNKPKINPDASVSVGDHDGEGKVVVEPEVKVDAAAESNPTAQTFRDAGGDVALADAPTFSCATLDLFTCTLHKACTILTGRSLVRESACLDQEVMNVACVDATMSCGTAETWAQSLKTHETWRFPIACLPPGFEGRENPKVGDCPPFQMLQLEHLPGLFGEKLRPRDVISASVERMSNGTAQLTANVITALDICRNGFAETHAECRKDVVINLTPVQLDELSIAAVALLNPKPIAPQTPRPSNQGCDPGPQLTVYLDFHEFSDCGGCCYAPDELKALSNVLERIIRNSI